MNGCNEDRNFKVKNTELETITQAKLRPLV